MFGITDLTTYLIGTIAIILLPGPNSIYCLTVAGQHGVKAAYRAVGGILLGDTLLILATALGAALAGGVQLVRVRTDRAANVAVHQELHAAVAAALPPA